VLPVQGQGASRTVRLPPRAEVVVHLGDILVVPPAAPYVAAQGAELSNASPVLAGGEGPTTFSGRVPAATIELAQSASDRWSLRVDGHKTRRRTAFGWANSFTVNQPGEATLSYRTSPTRRGALVLEALFWILALRRLLTTWRARRAALSGPSRLPALPPAPLAPVGAGAVPGSP